MALIAKETGSKFSLCPAGTHKAVCVDAIDKGMVKEQYANEVKEQHKIVLRFQIEDVDPATGKRYQVQKRYTLSLNEKANLRKDVEAWRGREFTREELDGFDLETSLIGSSCQLLVAHQKSKTDPTKVYAVIKSFMPLGRGVEPLLPLDYVRDVDRDPDHPDAEREPTSGGVQTCAV